MWQGRTFSQLSCKKIKILNKTHLEQTNTRQLLYTRTKQLAYLFCCHVFTILRFKSDKADCAVKSRVRFQRHEYHTSAALWEPTEVTVEKVTVP